MDISAIIARNLSALMEANPDRDTLIKVSKASRVGFGTVRRTKNGDGNVTVQNLDLIARAFRRSARDLLIDSEESYAPSDAITLRVVNDFMADERELLQGYRDASAEVREIMLDLARKASKKSDCEPNGNTNH
jgi:transcriptional regulator with XRE-family HTH domain